MFPNHTRYDEEWEELERLLLVAGRRLGRLSPEQLSRLDVLYRRAVVQLAQVDTRLRDPGLSARLNALVARAHAVIYLPPRRGRAVGVLAFLLAGFPRQVARLGRFHAAAAALLLVGIALAWLAVASDPAAAYALMPAGEHRLPGATREQLIDNLRDGRDQNHGAKFAFASFLLSHNLRVGLLSLSTGILAAIPSALLILYNGMVLGAFTAVHHAKEIQLEYWAWILPHGITELLALTLFGGCGLMLGWRWACPGWRTRGESLRAAAGPVAATCAGAALMLLVAAVVESYLRQSEMSDPARLAFALGSALLWLGYFGSGALLERRAVAAPLTAGSGGESSGSG